MQADPEWCGGISELLHIGTVASLHDVPVIPHGHSLRAAIHIIASQSPMTFPLGEYLIIKMRHYYHFESNPLVPDKAHIALPPAPASTSSSTPPRSNHKPSSNQSKPATKSNRCSHVDLATPLPLPLP